MLVGLRNRTQALVAVAQSRGGPWGWLAYGGALALLLQGTLRSGAPTQFTCSRLTDLTLSVRAMDTGAPPLLALLPGAGGGLYPAGYGDDVGPFLYLAPLGHLFHITNPYTLYRIEFVVLWSIVIIIWPLIFSRLFNSRLAGAIAPLLLVILVLEDAPAMNQYWIPGWAAAFCLPLLILAVKSGRARQPRARIWLLIGISALVAGFANTMRLGSGYGIAVAALGVAVLIARTWRVRAFAVVEVCGAFWLASTGVIDAATAYRNATYGNRPLASNFTAAYGGTAVKTLEGASHPFWHTFYIGLGFDRNRYGIYYSDSSAYNYVESVNPSVKSLSAEYASILQTRYFDLLSSDPTFVIGTYVHKAGVTVDMAVNDSWPLLILLPCILLATGRRRRLGVGLLVFAPALLVLLAVPTAVVPLNGYQDGFLNVVRLLLVVLLCWIGAEMELALMRFAHQRQIRWLDFIRGRYLAPYLSAAGPLYLRRTTSRDDRLPSALNRLPGVATRIRDGIPRQLLLVTAAVVVVELGASVGASAVAAHERESLTFPNGRPSEQNRLTSHEAVLRSFPTAQGLPDWEPTNGATGAVQQGSTYKTFSLHTAPQKYAYQLAGPTLTLTPGTYQLWVNGSADRSGPALVAVDAQTGGLIASRGNGPGSGGWGLTFTLDRLRTIRLVLANYGGRAAWAISSIEVGVAPRGTADTGDSSCPFVPPAPGSVRGGSATLLPAVSKPVRVWTPEQLVRGWIPPAGPHASIQGTDMIVHTSASPYGWQLVSPPLDVDAGRHVLEVKGSTATGGLVIMAIDPGTQTVIAKRYYGMTIPGQGPISMTLPFSLDQAQAIQYVLANSTPTGPPSTVWNIEQIALARQR